MRRNRITQLPLRRLYFLQQSWDMRALMLALMYFEDGYQYPQIVKYLGISSGTIHTYLHMFPELQYSPEDYLIARQKLDNLRSGLYAGHW